jgi:hypothetical protein
LSTPNAFASEKPGFWFSMSGNKYSLSSSCHCDIIKPI